MATFTTYAQVGLKEDVSDIITDITPFDTPCFTMFKSEKVNARTFSWLQDALAATADNAMVEGADPTDATLGAGDAEKTNQTQILSKSFKVSGTADAVSTYGRAKETAYQLGKALKEVKRDLERAMVGVSTVGAAGDASTARKMKSVIDQIDNSIDADAAAYDVSNADVNKLTEDMVLDAGEDAYDNGSEVDTLMILPANANQVADFAAASGRNREINQGKTLVNAIDLYISPFGEYRVILNRHLKAGHALLMDPSMFRTCVLRPFSREVLAKTGDAERHFVVGEYSVKHMNTTDSIVIKNMDS